MINYQTDRTIADTYYTQLPTGGATQGDVWTKLPSGSNSSVMCDAVIITPRCDFAHNKSPVINYIPIVSLETYLLSVASFSLVRQFLADARETLRRKSPPLGVDAHFELDIPIEEVVQLVNSLIVPEDAKEKRQFEAARIDFQKSASEFISASNLLEKSKLTMDEVRSIAKLKQFNRLQNDLIRNNNTDTYFLPPCQNLISCPSVVLLRHLYTCPISLIEADGSNSQANIQPQRILRINSPFIEALMSKFAALFTRVGTRDIPEAAVSSFAIPYEETSK